LVRPAGSSNNFNQLTAIFDSGGESDLVRGAADFCVAARSAAGGQDAVDRFVRIEVESFGDLHKLNHTDSPLADLYFADYALIDPQAVG
jgi:hypothetical protein